MVENITFGNYNGPVHVPLTLRYLGNSVPNTPILFRLIPTPLFDLYYVLEIITFGNCNGPVYGPLTLRYPGSGVYNMYILFPSNSQSIVWPLLCARNYNGWKL